MELYYDTDHCEILDNFISQNTLEIDVNIIAAVLVALASCWCCPKTIHEKEVYAWLLFPFSFNKSLDMFLTVL